MAKKYLKKAKEINNLLWMQFKVYQKNVEFDYEIIQKGISKQEKIAIDTIKSLETITILDKYYG